MHKLSLLWSVTDWHWLTLIHNAMNTGPCQLFPDCSPELMLVNAWSKQTAPPPSIFPLSAAVILIVCFTGTFWWGPSKLSKRRVCGGYACTLLVLFCLCFLLLQIWERKVCRWAYYLTTPPSWSSHHWKGYQSHLFACCVLQTTDWAVLSLV